MLYAEAVIVAARRRRSRARIALFVQIVIDGESGFDVAVDAQTVFETIRIVEPADVAALRRRLLEPISRLGQIALDAVALEEALREKALRVHVAALRRGHEIVPRHERVLFDALAGVVAICEVVRRTHVGAGKLLVHLDRLLGIRLGDALLIEIAVRDRDAAVDAAQLRRLVEAVERLDVALLGAASVEIEIAQLDLGLDVTGVARQSVEPERLLVVVLGADALLVAHRQMIDRVGALLGFGKRLHALFKTLESPLRILFGVGRRRLALEIDKPEFVHLYGIFFCEFLQIFERHGRRLRRSGSGRLRIEFEISVGHTPPIHYSYYVLF